MATDPTQRAYRAPCPGCGAPVEFKSAQSTHAVCGYCQSTVVRSGDVLTRLGKMAELFDDHSPLQLMASGRAKLDGQEQPFTLIGRLQYKTEAGVWTEWVAFLQDGTMASLGEDNGAYVFTRQINPGRELPEASRFRLGATTAINGKSYSVAFSGSAQLLSAQGELPKLPPLGQPFDMVELRSADGEVLSIDYGHTPPNVERGTSVLLEDLQLQGLKDASAKEEKGRQFNCPHCGPEVPDYVNFAFDAQTQQINATFVSWLNLVKDENGMLVARRGNGALRQILAAMDRNLGGMPCPPLPADAAAMQEYAALLHQATYGEWHRHIGQTFLAYHDMTRRHAVLHDGQPEAVVGGLRGMRLRVDAITGAAAPFSDDEERSYADCVAALEQRGWRLGHALELEELAQLAWFREVPRMAYAPQLRAQPESCNYYSFLSQDRIVVAAFRLCAQLR
eukprot:gene41797-51802_t